MVKPGKLYAIVRHEFWLLTDIHHGAVKLTHDEAPFLVLSFSKVEELILDYFHTELLTSKGTIIKGMQRDLWFNESHLKEVTT